MKTLGLIQPWGAGDIIICLPIVKKYFDLGYKIIFPVSERYCNMFQQVVKYVDFVSIPHDFENAYQNSVNVLKGCDKIVDLCFGFPNTDIMPYVNQSLTFDAFKYKLAGIDFNEKWNLQIERNKEDEMNVYNRVVRKDDYVVYHTDTLRGVKDFVYTNHEDCQHIDIDPDNDGVTGIFSWLTVLEKAKKIILTNSCYLNLVNQLNINEHNRVYLKSCRTNNSSKEFPVLKGNWEII